MQVAIPLNRNCKSDLCQPNPHVHLNIHIFILSILDFTPLPGTPTHHPLPTTPNLHQYSYPMTSVSN